MYEFDLVMGVHALGTIPTVFIFDPIFAQLSFVQLLSGIILKIYLPVLVILGPIFTSSLNCNLLLTLTGQELFRVEMERAVITRLKWLTLLPEMLGH